MRFTVIWDVSALNELARIWNNARDQQAVADAADLIDQILRIRADKVGQDFGTFRMHTVAPLTVVFKVIVPDQAVRVLDVWRSA